MHVAWKVWSSHLQGLIEVFLTGTKSATTQGGKRDEVPRVLKVSSCPRYRDVRCHWMHAPASDDSLIVQLRVVQHVSVIATCTCAGVSASGWLMVCGRSLCVSPLPCGVLECCVTGRCLFSGQV